MIRRGLAVSLLIGLARHAGADGPLPLPSDYKTSSLNGRCYAFLDAKRKKTTVFEQNKGGPPRLLWEMPGWFRLASLSNDCIHLVIGFDGSNLLPLDYSRDQAMVSFYERGKMIRAVKLNEMIQDLGKLRRTVSHYYWGHFLGFDQSNHYLVETVEGRRLAFDASTGRETARSK